jgi:outer membrane protein assembly factor BamA
MKKNNFLSGPCKKYFLPFLLLFSIGVPVQVSAQMIALDRGQTPEEKRTGWLPYIFATDSLGTAIGAGGFTASGKKQPQASLFGTAFVTSNESALVSGAWNNHRFGKSRFFLDSFVLADHFTDQRFYLGQNLDPNESRPGSNDSDPDNYVTGVSNEVTVTAALKYRLPIGNLKDDPVATYRLYQGLLESGPKGGDTWNPMTSGQTTLAGKFFYTYRDLDEFVFNERENDPVDEEVFAKTNGLEFWLEYDNTDFPRNPTKGSRQLLKVTSDFGWGESRDSWTNLEADLSKYVNLGSSNWFRQKSLAFNFWTSNTTDWEENADGTISHQPPPSYGSSLGGYDRMRAYPTGRFHDKAAVYYSAEMRFIPQTQPLRDLPLLNYFEIDWWQLVPFIEAGRVSDEYDSDLFFKDLKVDAGIGLRLMAFRAVVRLDWAVSDEGNSVWAMISQPFSRQGN